MHFFNSFNKKRKPSDEDSNKETNSGENFKKPRLSQQFASPSLTKVDREKICEQRKELPIFTARNRFLEEVKKAETVILVGETGSGKTTQIPQFLYEAKLNLAQNLVSNSNEFRGNLNATCCIAITQPRRVAAISLAKRVGEEIQASASVKIGPELPLDDNLVGYKVRFEDATTDQTRLIFQTDGMLLREAMLDPLLSRYSWVILDEAHERTVNTDILFGIVKNAQKRRAINFKNRSQNKNNVNNEGPKSRFFCDAPLKVIVMSATLDAEKFAAYFKNAPILLVHGRQHPVNIRHVSQSQDDWQASIMTTIFQIHRDAPPKEDILVFLTGQEEIETMTQQIRQICLHEESLNHSFRTATKLIPLPLYASQQTFGQQKVFAPSREGTRKVILSTNIAETSITIPGVKYVIDSCRVKAKVHIGSIGLDMLQVVKISQAQGLQRTGRAGRQGEGHCYRMLTKNEFDRLPKETVPEIKRSNLCSVLLQMLSIGIRNVSTFDFLEPPPKEAVQSALRQLALLGAIQSESESKPDQPQTAGNANASVISPEEKVFLTPLGKTMSAFPLDPKYTKAILCAKDLGCTEEVITIVSLLYGDQSILLTPASKREEALAARKKFISSEGDLITYLNIFRAFKQAKNQNEFCATHYVHQRNLQFAMEVRRQLMQLCVTHSIPVQSCANHTEIVRKALAQGMFTNVARLTREGNYVTLDSSQEVKLHPSSVMFGYKPELVIFCTLMATQKSYIRDLSLVDPIWLQEAQPEYFRKHRIIVSQNE